MVFVQDHIQVIRCLICQKFGHLSKYCKSEVPLLCTNPKIALHVMSRQSAIIAHALDIQDLVEHDASSLKCAPT